MEGGTKNQSKLDLRNNVFTRYLREHVGMLANLFFLIVLFSLMSEYFFTASNAMNILRQITINAIIAFGMTYVILLGGIDLSVGSIVAVSQTTMVSLFLLGVPLPVAIICGIIMGGIIGLLNGFIVGKLKVPAFIATLATMSAARGLAYVYTNGRPMRIESEALYELGNGYLGIFPVPVLIMVGCYIIFSFILGKTRYGRRLYAIGGSREAAVFSGINVKKLEMSVYIISGLLAGLGGIILSARMSSAQPISGQGFELDAIAAVVIGGTALSGGKGKIQGTILGAMIIGVLNNGLNLIQVPSYWQLIIKGLIIVLAVSAEDTKIMSRLFKKKEA